jgi:hypothetical protein
MSGRQKGQGWDWESGISALPLFLLFSDERGFPYNRGQGLPFLI